MLPQVVWPLSSLSGNYREQVGAGRQVQCVAVHRERVLHITFDQLPDLVGKVKAAIVVPAGTRDAVNVSIRTSRPGQLDGSRGPCQSGDPAIRSMASPSVVSAAASVMAIASADQ